MKEALGIEAELVKGAAGAFEIVADGELVFSKLAENRFPEVSEVVEVLRRGD